MADINLFIRHVGYVLFYPTPDKSNLAGYTLI